MEGCVYNAIQRSTDNLARRATSNTLLAGYVCADLVSERASERAFPAAPCEDTRFMYP